MEEIKPKFEPKKPVPANCIRKEWDNYSVFKIVNGVKYFLGIRDTKEKAEDLYRSKA